MEEKVVALTTSDNPFDPIKDFDRWWKFDEAKGYHTCGYLDKIAVTSEIMSDSVNAKAIEDAIDEIVKLNLIGFATGFEVNYRKIVH